MSVKKLFSLTALLATATLSAFAGPAVQPTGQSTKIMNPRVSLIEIQQKVLKTLPGDRVVEISLEKDHDSLVYNMDLASGHYLKLSADTGATLKMTQEKPEKTSEPAISMIPKLTIVQAQELALKNHPEAKLQEVTLEVLQGVLVYTFDTSTELKLILNADTGEELRI